MSIFTENLAETLFILGISMLIIEVVVLSLYTIVLFMLGCALILTAIAVYVGLLPPEILDAVLVVAILTGVLTAGLWKPFKNLQNQRDDSPVSSDLVGFTFVLAEDVSLESHVTYKYSGIEWRLVSAVPLNAGTKVRVSEVAVGEWTIEAF